MTGMELFNPDLFEQLDKIILGSELVERNSELDLWFNGSARIGECPIKIYGSEGHGVSFPPDENVIYQIGFSLIEHPEVEPGFKSNIHNFLLEFLWSDLVRVYHYSDPFEAQGYRREHTDSPKQIFRSEPTKFFCDAIAKIGYEVELLLPSHFYWTKDDLLGTDSRPIDEVHRQLIIRGLEGFVLSHQKHKSKEEFYYGFNAHILETAPFRNQNIVYFFEDEDFGQVLYRWYKVFDVEKSIKGDHYHDIVVDLSYKPNGTSTWSKYHIVVHLKDPCMEGYPVIYHQEENEPEQNHIIKRLSKKQDFFPNFCPHTNYYTRRDILNLTGLDNSSWTGLYTNVYSPYPFHVQIIMELLNIVEDSTGNRLEAPNSEKLYSGAPMLPG